ncbi:hypothetical protein HYT56_00940 [Candidatus Woesearchaeota archaeon]|nr:hypothetical protein [Candidatus Woesearchaeota archaeon]
MQDLVKFIKGWEREFLEANKELYADDRLEFLRKRDEFVSNKLIERRSNNGQSGQNGQEEQYS